MERMSAFIRTIPRKIRGPAASGITDSERALLEQMFDPASKLNINNIRGQMQTGSRARVLRKLGYWLKKEGADPELFR